MKPIITGFGILWVFICLVSCTTGPIITPTPLAATENAELAPDFRLTALDGQIVALSALRGRWVLINFWATWCVPCREEMPYLQALAATHRDQVTVLGINMRERADDIQPFVDELGITFPILLDPEDETLLAYNIRGLPLSFVVSPQGEIVWRQAGPLPADFARWLAGQLPYSQ